MGRNVRDFFKLIMSALFSGASLRSGLMSLFSSPERAGGGLHVRNRRTGDGMSERRKGYGGQGLYNRPRWGRKLNGVM